MRVAPVLLALALALGARPAYAVDPVPSFRYLVTGNGYGFQVFDVAANAIKQYLEHPYRYLRANPSNPDGEGIVRRNLVFDTYFGVRVGGTSTWLGGASGAQVGYVAESTMIRSAVTVSGVQTESFFVSPFGYAGNAMVMLLEVTNTSAQTQSVTAFSIHNFKLGSAPNPDQPNANGEAITYDPASRSAAETGPGGGVMIYAPIGGSDVSTCDGNAYTTVASGGMLTPLGSCGGSDLKNAFAKNLGSLAPGATAWWGVAVLFDDSGDPAPARQAWSTFLGNRTADQLYTDVLAELEAWRKPPVAGLDPTETSIWRQAESVLRMGQIAEPYTATRHNHGMILASLPPGGWHTGWVRDASYATAALARAGHADMAKDSLDFFLGADAGRYGAYVGSVPYRISTVRYYGDGQEEADYSGQPTRNIEIDGWGLFLWAARTYVDASGDTAWLASQTKQGDIVYDAIKSGVADALATNMDPSGMAIADASIWEVHWGNRQHFLYTTAAAARGFCDMATLARRANKMDDIATYRALAQKAIAAMTGGFIDSNHVLAGSLERLQSGASYHDGASVEPFTWSLIDGKDPIAKATLDGFSYLVTPAGGYKRLEGSSDQYDTDEWILIDLRASAAFRRAGQTDKADQLLSWVTGQASVNFGLLPELYNAQSSAGQIGAYSGSIPMVGYGAGAYVMTLLDRAGMYEHADCGEYDSGQYPDGGTGPGSGGGPADPRTGVACACQGGQGSSGNALLFALTGMIALRKRKGRRTCSGSSRSLFSSRQHAARRRSRRSRCCCRRCRKSVTRRTSNTSSSARTSWGCAP